jgi:predicted methyltransferase
MRSTALAALIALSLPSAALLPSAAFAQSPATSSTAPASYIAAAINDPRRKTDSVDDARRKIAAVMTFAEVRPGQHVLEIIPGGGYWTRVFSGIVGPVGHVYAVFPDEYDKVSKPDSDKLRALAKQQYYGNISVLTQPANQLAIPDEAEHPVDLVFTAQNFHDYPDKFMGNVDPVAFSKQVFAALRPGGLFVVIDHVAETGSGLRDTDTLHRIDPEIVKKDVEAAGFVFDGESDTLRNPADTHTIKVFDPTIRGKTDQFMFRFRKPAT